MHKFKPLIFALAIIFIQTGLMAQDPVGGLVKNSGEPEDYPGVQVLTIFDSTTVDVQESGLSYFYIHQLYKVMTDKGAAQLSVIKFPYEPQSAALEIKEVKIFRHDGSTEILPKEKIFDYPTPATLILWGAREQMAAVGRLEPGDAVEVTVFKKGYTYALLQDGDEDKYIPPMRGHYYDIVPFWVKDFTLEKVYRTIVPNTKKLQYEFYHGEVLPKVRLKGDKTEYAFTKYNIKPYKREPNMVSLFDVAPKLILTTAPDWQSKSTWFYGVNEDYGSFEWITEIKDKVDEILEGAEDEMDSVSRLTHWVADEIRYFGLTMGEGEGYTLHKGEMTFRDRCGVCKDKAGMLVTMLRAAGFESYAAMTMAGSRIEDIPADHFNHSVTAVRLSDGKLHMLDPTWVPFVRELWSSREQQQNYIVGTKEGEDLQVIPISDPENHYYKIKGNAELDEKGNLKGEFTLEAEGQSDAAFRGYFTRTFRKNWDGFLEGELKKQFPRIQIENIIFDDPYDYSKPFRLYVKYSISSYAIIAGNKVFFSPVVLSNLFASRNYHTRINTNLKERKNPFKDACSKYILLEESIKIPEGYSLHYAPEHAQKDGSGASFKATFTQDGNVLRVKEEISLKKRVYETEDWPSFRHALMGQQKFAEEKVVLLKSTEK